MTATTKRSVKYITVQHGDKFIKAKVIGYTDHHYIIRYMGNRKVKSFDVADKFGMTNVTLYDKLIYSHS